MNSLPGSQDTATIWPGCTLAPKPTMTSAKRLRVASSIRATLRGRGQVRRVVEGAQQPPRALDDDEPRQRSVVGVDERERPAVRRLPARLADDAAVHDGGDPGVRAGRGDDRLDARPHPRREGVHPLRARDRVPPLLRHRLQRDRVALGDPDAELATLVDAERHLAQLGHNDRLQAEPGGERRRGLRRPPERGDEEAGEPLVREPLAHRRGLRLALGTERRVAVPVDEREPAARDGDLGRAVADEHDLGGPRREAEPALGIAHGGADYAAGGRAAAARKRRGRDSNPRYRGYRYNGFRDRPI